MTIRNTLAEMKRNIRSAGYTNVIAVVTRDIDHLLRCNPHRLTAVWTNALLGSFGFALALVNVLGQFASIETELTKLELKCVAKQATLACIYFAVCIAWWYTFLPDGVGNQQPHACIGRSRESMDSRDLHSSAQRKQAAEILHQ